MTMSRLGFRFEIEEVQSYFNLDLKHAFIFVMLKFVGFVCATHLVDALIYFSYKMLSLSVSKILR